MIIVCNTLRVKEGTRDAMIEELNKSGAEEILRSLPGCVHYSYSASISDKDVLYLTDIWENEDTFQAHKQHPIVKTWREIKARYVVDSKPFLYRPEE